MNTITKKPDGSLDYHAMLAMPKLIEGARVRISAAHLRQTGQHYGNPAPTSHGPFARGTLEKFDDDYIPGKRLAWVMWDDGNPYRIRPELLWPDGVTEPA